MLTNIGEAVGTAMQELSELNSNINDAHAELANLDQHIQVYGADATYEEVEKAEAAASENVANEVEPELEAEA
jgi:phage-related protein